jgi:4-hydroxybenzoate polyprenyltransferase
MTSRLSHAWRIVYDAAVYRIKKREGGNLATSMTLAVALRLEPSDIGLRFLFGALLNVFVYLVNDCFDVEIDIRAKGRDTERTQFLHAHQREAWLGVTLLGLVLLAIAAAIHRDLVITLLVNVALIVAYSRIFKRNPVVDIVSMGLWGVTMAMVGFPLDDPMGWRMAGLLGVLSMVTESVQVLRDRKTDEASGVKTSAVVFGPKTAIVLARVLSVAGAAYAFLVLRQPIGLLLILGAAIPLDEERAAASWDWYRALFGVVWLAVCALVFLHV